MAVTMNIAIFLKKAFFIEHPLVAASELKCNISNTNRDKNKKKLFLYFDTSHSNETNKHFFSYNININKNLKKTDEKKCCFKRI